MRNKEKGVEQRGSRRWEILKAQPTSVTQERLGETKLFHAPTPHPSPSSQASIQGPFVNTTPLTMRAPAVLLLAGVFAALSHSASALVVNFTGDVALDFPIANTGVFVATDTTNDVFFTDSGTLKPTGWNAYDVRFAYDAASDTAYFGEFVRSMSLAGGS